MAMVVSDNAATSNALVVPAMNDDASGSEGTEGDAAADAEAADAKDGRLPDGWLNMTTETLRPGDATHFPTRGQTIRMHYEGRLPDGTVFDSSWERQAPMLFKLNMGQVARARARATPQCAERDERSLRMVLAPAPRGKEGAASVARFGRTTRETVRRRATPPAARPPTDEQTRSARLLRCGWAGVGCASLVIDATR